MEIPAEFFSSVASYLNYQPQPSPTITTGSQAASSSTLTGIKNSEVESQLFGKNQPLFVGGQALIGCRIIEGPFIYNMSGVTMFDAIFDVATPIDDLTDTNPRTIDYLNLNGTKSWTAADGGIGPFSGIT